MKWKRWREWSTKASDASKRGSLVVSNPRCLISQIAVTFDEGDWAGAKREMGPVREGVCVCIFFFFFLLMCTVQIQLCTQLLNKSFFKYELCCLQQFSASRHPPLSAYTASVHLTLPPCLSAIRTLLIRCTIPHFSAEYACSRMLNAHTRTHAYTYGNMGERENERKEERKTVWFQERVCGDWCYILLVSAGSWPAD